MSKAIGLIEFSSIAKGIEACDVMLKSSQTEIIRAATVCPGKYIVVISGNTSDIQTAIKNGKNSVLKYVVDTLIVPNAEQGLINAMQGKEKHSINGAIGIMEFYSISSAIQAADTATKTANVTLFEIKMGYAIGGKGVVIIAGDSSSVKQAVEAAIKDKDLLISSAVITKPSDKLWETL